MFMLTQNPPGFLQPEESAKMQIRPHQPSTAAEAKLHHITEEIMWRKTIRCRQNP